MNHYTIIKAYALAARLTASQGSSLKAKLDKIRREVRR